MVSRIIAASAALFAAVGMGFSGSSAQAAPPVHHVYRHHYVARPVHHRRPVVSTTRVVHPRTHTVVTTRRVAHPATHTITTSRTVHHS